MKKAVLFFVLVSLFTIVNAEMIMEMNTANPVNIENTRNDPPTNLLATLVNYNDVQLSWMEPGAASILWDQIDPEGETFGKSAQDFEAAYNQYDAEVSGDFVLTGLAEITGAAFNFFYNAAYTDPVPFNVWIFPDVGGVPSEDPIHTLVTPAVLPDEFQVYEVEFDEPFVLDAGTYWIGYNMTLSYTPLSIQCYANQKVSVINETPGYWRNPGDGFATGFTTWTADINSQGGAPEDITFQVHGNYLTAANRELLGYNVFRNDVQINTALITDTEYDDMGLDAGSYEYHVIAVYDDGDSDPSNTQLVDVTLPAPVSFAANLAGANVVCQWQAPPDESRELTGYNIYRNDEVVGESTSNFFVDQGVPAGLLVYYVTARYGDYESGASNSVEINNTDAGNDVVPSVTTFNGNYPNPFNPTTYLSYSLSEDSYVILEIYNSRGQMIYSLVNGEVEAGNYSLLWDGTTSKGAKAPSGIYFSKFKAGLFTSTKKMILMK